MSTQKPALTDRDLDEYEAWAKGDLRGNLGQQAAARRTLELLDEVREHRARVAASNEGLERTIVGALRSAIRDHGPITPEHIGSAAKRILGNLRNASTAE